MTLLNSFLIAAGFLLGAIAYSFAGWGCVFGMGSDKWYVKFFCLIGLLFLLLAPLTAIFYSFN